MVTFREWDMDIDACGGARLAYITTTLPHYRHQPPAGTIAYSLHNAVIKI